MSRPTAPSVFGGDATYGASSVFGGTWTPYQWRVDPSRQKCMAMQVTVSDVQDGAVGTSGQGMSLTALSFEVGVQKGLNRVPAAQSVG